MIRNVTRKTILSEKSKRAVGFMDKVFGLILSSNKNYGLIFESRFGIHTYFMKYPIDVLVLDKNKKVVQIKEDLKPNKIYLWNPKFGLIVELPEGSIKSSNTKVDDMLVVSNE